MKAKKAKRARPSPKRNKKRVKRNGPMNELIVSNVYSALRDESYTLIARLVDDTLKDPVLREKISKLTRQILKLIAENI